MTNTEVAREVPDVRTVVTVVGGTLAEAPELKTDVIFEVLEVCTEVDVPG